MQEKISKTFLVAFLLASVSSYILHGYLLVDHYNPHFDIPGAPSSSGSTSIGLDFTWSWFGTKNALDHESLYHTTRTKAANHTANYFNLPPLIPLLYAPLGHVDSDTGYKIYVFAVLIAWATILFSLSKLFEFQFPDYILTILIFFLSCPYRFDLERGNAHAITFAFALLAITALFRYRSAPAAALFLSIASFMRVSPILIPCLLLCMGHIRFFIWFSAISLAIFFLSGGIPVYESFYNFMLYYNFELVEKTATVPSTVSALLLLLGDTSKTLVTIFANIFNLAVLLFVSLLAFKGRKTDSREQQLGLLAIGFILSRMIPSLSFLYSLTYLPFIFFAGRDLLGKTVTSSRIFLIPAFTLLLTITLLTPLGWLTPHGDFNFLQGLSILPFLQQLWFPLIGIAVILFYLILIIPASTPRSAELVANRTDARIQYLIESFAVFLFLYLCINAYFIGTMIP